MNGHLHRIDSPQLGRKIHLWSYGWFGPPMLVFPSAAGMAHEWEHHGMIEALKPLLRAGKLKLYCVESNVAEAWTKKEQEPAWRIARHALYEDWVMSHLVPWVRADCRHDSLPIATAGASLGGLYAALFALKHPETFPYALCLSGRYEARHFTQGFDSPMVYFNNPLAFVPGLQGEALARVQRTFIQLVCGQGAYEEGCIEETILLGRWLAAKQIPHHTDIWGRDSAHQWPWWRRQAVLHLGRRFG